MGQSLSYVAVKGKSKEEIWQDLGLSKSPQQDFAPHMRSKTQIYGAPMLTDWYLIQDHGWKLINNKEKMALLSTNADVLTGAVEEHCMYCMAAGWNNGTKNWEVTHRTPGINEDLQVTGLPPTAFEKVKKRVIAEMTATPEEERHDFYFSIPVDLFETLTGFSYCCDDVVDDDEGEILVLN